MFFVKSITALAVASLAQGATIPVEARSGNTTFTPVAIPFTVRRGANSSSADSIDIKSAYANARGAGSLLGKRNDDDPIYIDNLKQYYTIQVEIGSNRQQLELDVDTGSSDLWVIDSSVQCSNCKLDGQYDPSSSSTAEYLSNYPDFSISYMDGTGAKGYFYQDTIAIGALTVDNCIFADVDDTGKSMGMFGIGLESLEATEFTADFEYTNFPQQLVQNGLIAKNAYSLYLNSYLATSGVLIFGGYDEDKVDGSFTTLPLTTYNRFAVEFDTFSLPNGETASVSETTAEFGNPVLDCGFSYWAIPNKYGLRDQVVSSVGADTSTFEIDCSAKGTLTLNWGQGFSVDYEISDMIYTYYGNCYFMMQDEEDFAFGDTILRSLYIIYDLTDLTVSIAKVQYTSSSNIVAIE